MTIIDGDDALLRVGQAARLLYVHDNTLRRWADLGIVSAYRISSRGDRRFSRNEVVSLLERVRSNGGRLLEGRQESSPDNSFGCKDRSLPYKNQLE